MTGSRFYSIALAVTIAAIMYLPMACHGQTASQQGSGRDERLRKFLQDYLRDPYSSSEEEKTIRYLSAFVDLRDDGAQEVIVYVTGRGWCGSGGCDMWILAPEGSSYKVVTHTTITQLPIRVLATKSHGWHDLGVWVQGGGIQPGYEAKLSFDGKTYPSNPSMPPAVPLTKKVPGRVAVPVTALTGGGKPLYP